MINLPHSGTANWGIQLNETIRRLYNDLNNIKMILNKEDLVDTQKYTAFVGSGVTTLESFSATNTASTSISLAFKGSWYFIGPERINFVNQEVKGTLNTLKNNYYYLYLKYDGTEETPTTNFEANVDFLVNWQRIMIGILYKKDGKWTFLQKIFSPYKTSFQHLDENNRRHVDIPCDSIILSDYNSEKPTIALTNVLHAYYYADGLNFINYNSGSESYERIDLLNYWNQSGDISLKIETVLLDKLESGKLITDKATTSAGKATKIFRILTSANGDFVLQYHHSASSVSKDYINNYVLLENYIKNLAFNDEIESYCIGHVEVARGFYFDSIDMNKITNLDNLEFQFFDNFNHITSNSIIDGLQFSTLSDQRVYTKIESDATSLFFDSDSVYSGTTWIDQKYKTIMFLQGGVNHSNSDTIEKISELGEFITNGQQTTAILPTCTIFLSDKNGLSPFPGTTLWDGKTGIVEIDKLNFTSTYPDNTKFFNIKVDSNNLIENRSKIYTLLAGNPLKNGYFLTSDYNTTDEEQSINISAPEIVLNNIKLIKDGTVNKILSNDENINSLYLDYETVKANNINMEINGVLTYLSDRRHKENICNNNMNCLDIVVNTPIVDFNYINSSPLHVGLISQDLVKTLEPKYKDSFIQTVQEDLVPDCLRLKETKLVYILWKALQEMNEELESVKKELKNCKTREI